MRGFACIGLDRPKIAANVGAVLRAAHAFGAAQVTIAHARKGAVQAPTNVSKAERRIPVVLADDVLDYRPHGCQVVAVDLVDGAVPLPEFKHPAQALYVFGAEDATLGERILSRAQHRVMVPTAICLNLAATVNVILYDRLMKGGDFGVAYEGMSDAQRAAFHRRKAA